MSRNRHSTAADRIFQALFLKTQDEGRLEYKTDSAQMAMGIRLRIYEWKKRMYKREAELEEGLFEALTNVAMTIEGKSLVFVRKDQTDAMQGLAALLDKKDLEGVVTPEQKAIADSERKLEDLFAKVDSPFGPQTEEAKASLEKYRGKG